MYYGRNDFDDRVVSPLEQARRVAEARARLFPQRPRKKPVRLLPPPKPVEALPPPKPLTYMDLVRLASPARPGDPPPTKRVTIRLIIAVVCRHYGILQSDLAGHTRKRKVVAARHVAMHLMRVMTSNSTGQIGAALGGKDHTTVIHGTQRILALLGTGHPLDEDITALNEIIGRLVSGEDD